VEEGIETDTEVSSIYLICRKTSNYYVIHLLLKRLFPLIYSSTSGGGDDVSVMTGISAATKPAGNLGGGGDDVSGKDKSMRLSNFCAYMSHVATSLTNYNPPSLSLSLHRHIDK